MRCDWNFAQTLFETVLEYFCRIEVGLRKNFFVQRGERRGMWTWNNFVQVKKESKVRQVRSEVRSPVR